MSTRAALVTGASRGIGLAIARVLGEEGYDLTVSSRSAERLEAAAAELRDGGAAVHAVACDVSSEQSIVDCVRSHRERYGRLDVLVNNAGIGIGGKIDGFPTKHMDMQWAINLRAPMLFCRESIEMLRAAGEEHKNAIVINTSSIAGTKGAEWLAVYSATKHGVVGFTEALNQDLRRTGVKACAFCPAYVDTALSDYVKDRVPPSEMIQPDDLGEAVRYLLKLSPYCLVPEVIFERPCEEPL